MVEQNPNADSGNTGGNASPAAETSRSQPRATAGRRDRRFARRAKVCPFCEDKARIISYKQVDLLERFLTDRGSIRSRRKIGTCAKHQRRLATAIKRARHLALLPYTAEHIRTT